MALNLTKASKDVSFCHLRPWNHGEGITGTVLLIIRNHGDKNLFVILVCRAISLLMIFCGKDTNLFSNFKILTKKNDQTAPVIHRDSINPVIPEK